MNEPQDKGKQLDSLDFVEAACELLEKSPFNYILYVGTHTKGTTIQSHLDDDSALMLQSWLTSGNLNKITWDHLKQFFPHLFE